MELLTGWDADPTSPTRVRRRELGRRLGADLARSGAHPEVIRLLVHGEPVERAAVTSGASIAERTSRSATGLADDTIGAALAGGLFDEFTVDGVPYLRARACVLPDRLPDGEPVWVACDLPWEVARPDHVPGPGNASRTLLDALAVRDGDSAADIGTGCGFVALYLATFVQRVVATDVNPRALAFAEFTAALNGRAWDLRLGSFLEPIVGEACMLVVANPPFVIGNPDDGAVFRDGHAGLAAALARDIAAALPAGGTGQFLGNWAYTGDRDPTVDIVHAASGVDCLVVERAVVPPPAYAALWTDDPELQARWIATLEAAGVAAIGTGVVTVHRSAGTSVVARTGVARLYERADEPLGPAIADWLASD